MRVEIVFAGLGAPTSDAHIHCCIAPLEVPEPASFALLGIGLTALAAARRKRARESAAE